MAETYPWKNEYTIGIERIDHQHRYFLELVNWLPKLFRQTEQSDLLNRYIDEIILYARFHFLSEENLMQFYDYPDTQSHAELHANMLSQLSLKMSLMDLGDITKEEFGNFLVQWFFGHTVEEDPQLGLFLKTRMNAEK